MTHRQASIFRDGFSQLQMEAQQTAAFSNRSHFYSPAPDRGPLKALASATQAQTITAQYCNYVFQPVGPPSHRLFWTMWEVPWLCTVFPLPAPSKTSWEPFPNHPITMHSVFQHGLSDILWVSYIRRATAGLELGQRLFPSVFLHNAI